MKRYFGPVLVGVLGVAVLLNLGFWQLRRLEVKEAKLAEITAMLTGAPVALPSVVTEAADRYRGVVAEGLLTGEAIFKLDSLTGVGPGKRVIAVLELAGGRRVLVDCGLWLDGTDAKPQVPLQVRVTGNLDWPQETDSYTPPPDPKSGLWFARDVGAMAADLGTEATLIVARAPVRDGIEPAPVDVSAIPNDHWNYALTWFSLAAVWAVMTALLLWRIRRRNH
jgi:surfeit locus 1 family protein